MTALVAILLFIAHALWHALPFVFVALVAWWRKPKSRAAEDLEHCRRMAASDSTTGGRQARSALKEPS